MNNLKQKLLEEIKDFIKKALITTELFKKQFNIEGSPFKSVKRYPKHKGIIPMKGKLTYQKGEISYKFHGNGCEFIFPRNRIVDINYQSPEWLYDERISFHRIFQFVKSNPEFDDKEVLEKYLRELEIEGLIVAIPRPPDFKQQMAVGSQSSIEELEAKGFFDRFDSPRYKAYKLSENTNLS